MKVDTIIRTTGLMTLMSSLMSSSSTVFAATATTTEQQLQCYSNFTDASQIQDAINVLASYNTDGPKTLCVTGSGIVGSNPCDRSNTTITIPSTIGSLTFLNEQDTSSSSSSSTTEDFSPSSSFSFGCASIQVEKGANFTLKDSHNSPYAFLFQPSGSGVSSIVVQEGATANIQDAYFQSTHSSTNGGAIQNLGSTTIDNCSFNSCTSSYEGDTIYSSGTSSKLVVNNTYISVFEPNTNNAGGNGWKGIAIYADSEAVEIYNTEVTVQQTNNSDTPMWEIQQNTFYITEATPTTGCGLSGNAAPQRNASIYGYMWCDCNTGCEDVTCDDSYSTQLFETPQMLQQVIDRLTEHASSSSSSSSSSDVVTLCLTGGYPTVATNGVDTICDDPNTSTIKIRSNTSVKLVNTDGAYRSGQFDFGCPGTAIEVESGATLTLASKDPSNGYKWIFEQSNSDSSSSTSSGSPVVVVQEGAVATIANAQFLGPNNNDPTGGSIHNRGMTKVVNTTFYQNIGSSPQTNGAIFTDVNSELIVDNSIFELLNDTSKAIVMGNESKVDIEDSIFYGGDDKPIVPINGNTTTYSITGCGNTGNGLSKTGTLGYLWDECQATPDDGSKLSTGAIAGIAVAAVIVFIGLILLIVLIVRRRRLQSKSTATGQESALPR